MNTKQKRFNLRAGDRVKVRSKDEILKTLDRRGQLEGMPFMPEMFAYCGQEFPVYKRAHKTCDTVFPVRSRKLQHAVHLETRCDGKAHGGCEAGCLIFWKEAWLEKLSDVDRSCLRATHLDPSPSRNDYSCSESDVWAGTRSAQSTTQDITYVCQATQLPYATEDLTWWNPRQYLDDFLSGNVGLRKMLCGFVYSVYRNLSQARIGIGRPMLWLYDLLHPLWRGTLFPQHTGVIPVGQPTPSISLNVDAGELVRIKPHKDILQTVTRENKNKGMCWDAEMVPYCGQTHRVLRRVTKIINERTGKMQQMKSPCVILESVTCQSRYSNRRLFCPRSIYSYWREVWLERVSPNEFSRDKVGTSPHPLRRE
jgi:hypothetical protein